MHSNGTEPGKVGLILDRHKQKTKTLDKLLTQQGHDADVKEDTFKFKLNEF